MTDGVPVPNDDSNMRLTEIDDDLIERVRERIRSEINPQSIVLIGSAARGEAGPESDLDLVVVTRMAAGENPRDVSREIHSLFSGWRVPMDIVVLSPEQFDEGRELPGHIARVAVRSGKTLYERSA